MRLFLIVLSEVLSDAFREVLNMDKHAAIPMRGVTPISDVDEGEPFRNSPVASVISDHESETALDENSHLTESGKSTGSTDSDTRHSVISSLIASTIIEPMSNVIVTPTTAPRVGNLWAALRSGRVSTLLYSCLVAIMASLSFGYAMGFSSPALPDLDNNEGKHRFFNKTIYHDMFNVSIIIISPLRGVTPIGTVIQSVTVKINEQG